VLPQPLHKVFMASKVSPMELLSQLMSQLLLLPVLIILLLRLQFMEPLPQ